MSDATPSGAYRADCRKYLEFCQDNHVPAALSEFGLRVWIAYLEGEGVPECERRRMHCSVEQLFRHVGVIPEDEPEDLELD